MILFISFLDINSEILKKLSKNNQKLNNNTTSKDLSRWVESTVFHQSEPYCSINFVVILSYEKRGWLPAKKKVDLVRSG